MPKFKVPRVARTEKHVNGTSTTTDANKLPTLEVEEPPEFFPLLKLPRELRDEVLDQAALQRDRIAKSSSILSWPIIDFSVKKGKMHRRMMTWSHAGRSLTEARGAFAMLLASKQMHAEMTEAIARSTPHHAHATLIDYGNDESPIFRDQLFMRFPTAIRRLYVKNEHINLKCCLIHADAQSQLLGQDNWQAFRKYLRSCTALTELVVDFCALYDIHSWAISPVAFELFNALVTIIESSPQLRKYAVRTCAQAAYAVKRKGEGWTRADPSHLFKYRVSFPPGEWQEFLLGMGVDHWKWPLFDW